MVPPAAGRPDSSRCFLLILVFVGPVAAFKWSWAAPGDGVSACSVANQSLGIAGRPGEWFSFEPAAANQFHEGRLLAEEADTDVENSFSIDTDVFDGFGDIVLAAVPPTLHFRPGGAMLRWNTTSGSGPYYVRSVATAQRSITLAVPPTYSFTYSSEGRNATAAASDVPRALELEWQQLAACY